MLLTRYGLREWLAITIAVLAIVAVLAWFALWWGVAIVAVVWLAIVSFFRDPFRRQPAGLHPGAMLSPADGKVSAVERVDSHEAIDGPAVIVRIFLSVLDVHVNRSPCDGDVTDLAYTPGKFLDARTEESARVNESNLITLDVGGEPVAVRQVAGKVARRIVCKTRVGDRLRRGQKFGMIKFGSTAELVLPRPESVDVHVAKGDRVRGGLTVLATLAPA